MFVTYAFILLSCAACGMDMQKMPIALSLVLPPSPSFAVDLSSRFPHSIDRLVCITDITMVRTNTAGIDPWQAAFDGLPPELKASLIASRGYKLDVIAAVLDEAEQKKKICLQKRWKIKFHGHTIILRDIFDKIIAWANEYRAIGDVAMQFDPAAASLPWAGVRFLMHVGSATMRDFQLSLLTICRLP